MPAQSGLLARRTNMPASGPGAHGRLDIDGAPPRHRDRKAAGSLATRVEARGHGFITDEVLTPARAGRRISADGAAARRRHRSCALRRAGRPHARPEADRDLARARPGGDHADGRLRVTPSGFPLLDAVVADLGGVKLCDSGHGRRERPIRNARGGEPICGRRSASTRSTASPRSLVPSARKRNMPSMPEKPEDWSARSARSAAGLASSPTRRPARPRHRRASPCAPVLPYGRDSERRNCGSRAVGRRVPAAVERGRRQRCADRPTGRCRALHALEVDAVGAQRLRRLAAPRRRRRE